VERANRVLITGAQGFVGRSTVNYFLKKGFYVRAAVRVAPDARFSKRERVEYEVVGDIAQISDWSSYLDGCDIIVHLAARAHKTKEGPNDSASEFEEINVHASVKLAKNAAAMGVKRFVFISSAGVMGETSATPFTEIDAPRPSSEYAKSKYKAELELTSICAAYGMELVILRPTLVYGPGNPGNLERLHKLVQSHLPLPFAGIRNKRSLLHVSHLAKVIHVASVTPDVAGLTFLVSDGEDLTTSEIAMALAEAAGVRLRLFYVPGMLLFFVASIIGKRREIEKLYGSFQVDSSMMRKRLGIDVLSTRKAIKENIVP
jgi:nucleoside-diphosphate-sugar epimerase